MSAIVLEGTSLKALALNLTSLIENIPADIEPKLSSITEINLSFNELKEDFLSQLASFPNLQTIILDNNELTSLQGLPTMPKLTTLWLNNNQIADIEAVVSVLPERCPQLAYLSLLRNPCCPNELMGKGDAEYRRYRLYTRFRIPTLQRLDAAPFSAEEVKEAREKGRFLQTKASNIESGPSEGLPLVNSGFVAADVCCFNDQAAQERSLSSRCEGPYYFPQRHFYSGKASEGNRFIRDNAL